MTIRSCIPVYNRSSRPRFHARLFFFFGGFLFGSPNVNNLILFKIIKLSLQSLVYECAVLYMWSEQRRERERTVDSRFHQIVAQPTSPPT